MIYRLPGQNVYIEIDERDVQTDYIGVSGTIVYFTLTQIVPFTNQWSLKKQYSFETFYDRRHK